MTSDTDAVDAPAGPGGGPGGAELKRWRLVLGHGVDDALAGLGPGGGENGGGPSLTEDERGMDEALDAIYGADGRAAGGGRGADLGASAPTLARWLGDIRTYFDDEVVAVIQQDAIERRGLDELLLQPEALAAVRPDISLVGTLMSLSSRIPDETRETAREVIRKVVEELRKRLENDVRQAVTGALNRRAHSPMPRADSIDWKTTIARNVRNYQPSLGAIVPERFWFFARSKQVNAWHVIVALDQSGSMADSVVYGAVTGSIFASLPALQTRVVAFDTEVVDLTETCGDDPVDMLMGVQLGGGTDINKAVAYCRSHVTDPARTLFILISDLYEGGVEAGLLGQVRAMQESGVRTICLLALADSGRPSYDERLAGKLAALGVPSFACTPGSLPELVHGALSGADLEELAKRVVAGAKGRG